MTDGAGLGGLGLRDGEYQAHGGYLACGQAEWDLLAYWWRFVPAHFQLEELRVVFKCIMFSRLAA